MGAARGPNSNPSLSKYVLSIAQLAGLPHDISFAFGKVGFSLADLIPFGLDLRELLCQLPLAFRDLLVVACQVVQLPTEGGVLRVDLLLTRR